MIDVQMSMMDLRAAHHMLSYFSQAVARSSGEKMISASVSTPNFIICLEIQ